MNNVKEFGLCVTKMRGKRRLTTQELADRSGISYQTIWRIERGHHKDPSLFTAARLARALDCSLDHLVDLYEEDEDSELKPAAADLVGA
jgi:transcriptional regulator with XRE-family HTH domain